MRRGPLRRGFRRYARGHAGPRCWRAAPLIGRSIPAMSGRVRQHGAADVRRLLDPFAFDARRDRRRRSAASDDGRRTRSGGSASTADDRRRRAGCVSHPRSLRRAEPRDRSAVGGARRNDGERFGQARRGRRRRRRGRRRADRRRAVGGKGRRALHRPCLGLTRLARTGNCARPAGGGRSGSAPARA